MRKASKKLNKLWLDFKRILFESYILLTVIIFLIAIILAVFFPDE
jgi:hypothetical protein